MSTVILLSLYLSKASHVNVTAPPPLPPALSRHLLSQCSERVLAPLVYPERLECLVEDLADVAGVAAAQAVLTLQMDPDEPLVLAEVAADAALVVAHEGGKVGREVNVPLCALSACYRHSGISRITSD